MAIELLTHAIRMILTNVGEALKASVIPLAILLAAGIGFGGTMAGIDPETAMANPELVNPGPILMASILVIVVNVVVFSWLAVTWHRYILLAEPPSLVPNLTGQTLGPYILRIILIGLILIGLGIAGGLLASIIGAVLPFLFLLIGAALVFALSVIYLRLALSLPAVAVGQAMTIGEAWEKTKPHANTFLTVAVLLILLRIVAALPAYLFLLIDFGIVATALDIAANWFVLMVGIGILTTLYGHLVEGRPIS